MKQYRSEADTFQDIGSRPLPSGIDGPVKVPLFQGVITGVFAGIFAASVSLFLGESIGRSFAIGGLALSTVSLVSWLAFRGRWQWIIEEILLADINGDGFVGVPEIESGSQPQPQPQTIRVDVSRDNGARVGHHYVDDHGGRLRILADGLRSGIPFSEANWTPQAVLFSQPEFYRLQRDWIGRGLARWRGSTATDGVELTEDGWAVVEGISAGGDIETPPLPRDGSGKWQRIPQVGSR